MCNALSTDVTCPTVARSYLSVCLIQTSFTAKAVRRLPQFHIVVGGKTGGCVAMATTVRVVIEEGRRYRERGAVLNSYVVTIGTIWKVIAVEVECGEITGMHNR